MRAPRPGDGLAVYAAVAESLAELRAWPASLPWALQEPSPDESEAYCRRGHAAFLARTDLPLLVFVKGEDVLVGATGLHRLNWDVPKCEIGYWGNVAFRKRGYMSEAVTGAVDFAFTHLSMRRIECFADAENLSSRRVTERSGFALEGIMRKERKAPDGSLRDTCVYAITR